MVTRQSVPTGSGQALHDPRALPELRADLRALAVEGGAWEEAERWRQLNELAGNATGHSTIGGNVFGNRGGVIKGPNGFGPDELPDAINAAAMRQRTSMEWNRTTLDNAQCMWVSDEMCDVLFSTYDTIPDDTVLDESMPPTPFGLVVFERPFVGIDSGEHDSVRVDALMWGPVRLPDRHDPVHSIEGVHPGFAIATWRFMDPINHNDRAAAAIRTEGTDNKHLRSVWLPLGRADWCIGDPVLRPTHDMIDPASDAHASMIEDRKLIAALWGLVRQKRVVDRVEMPTPRPARKRLARAGQPVPDTITVVHLRRPEYRPSGPQQDASRRIGVRFVVRAHWRNQAWGPGRTRRRLILIPPHVKGPEDAPMKHAERVWAVDQ